MIRPYIDSFAARNYASVAVFIAGFALYVALLYPGFMTVDSVVQILEGRDGVFSDWHPPAMALLWGWVDRVIAGPTGMLFIQTALIWFGIYLVHDAYFREGRSLPYAWALFALMFFPLIVCIAGVIWKDVWMWATLVLALGLIGLARKYAADRARRTVFLVLASGTLVSALLFRHNAIFAVMPLILLGTQVERPANTIKIFSVKLVVTVVVGAVLFLLAGKINGELASRKTYPWIGNAAFDVSGVIVRMDDPAQQQLLFDALSSALKSHAKLSTLKSSYSSAYWFELFRGSPPALDFPPESPHGDNGFFGLPEQNRNDLKRLWLQTMFVHPVLWLEHRTAVFSNVLGIDKAGRWDLAVFDPNDYPKDWATRYEGNPAASNLQTGLQWRINWLAQCFLFRPLFYLLLLIGLMVFALSKERHRQSASIYVIASGLLHEAGLWLAAPSPDYRYSHYMVFCCLLSILLLLSERQNSRVASGAHKASL